MTDGHPIQHHEMFKNEEYSYNFSDFCKELGNHDIPVDALNIDFDQHYCHYCKSSMRKFETRLEDEKKHRKWSRYVCHSCGLDYTTRMELTKHTNKCKNRVGTISNNTIPMNSSRYLVVFKGLTEKGQEMMKLPKTIKNKQKE